MYLSMSGIPPDFQFFPETISLPAYLSRHDVPFKSQMALCRFRLGIHDLEINRGAWKKIPREDRLCRLCLEKDDYEIEDEPHFLLACPSYTALRHTYTDIFTAHPGPVQDQGGDRNQRVTAILNDHQLVKQIGEFISSALTARTLQLHSLNNAASDHDQEDLSEDE
jgi:hypothetical protein